jgi:hypothetical protein
MKPRSIENLIKDSWSLYKDNLNNFIIAALIFMAVSFVLVIFIFLAMIIIPVIFGLVNPASYLIIISVVIIGLLFYLLFVAFMTLEDIVFILIAKSAQTRKKLTLSKVLHISWPKFWSLFWINIIISLIILLGFIFFIIPGIILSIYLIFAKYLIVIDDVRGFRSLRLSARIVSGHFWEVIVLSLVFSVVSLLTNSIGGGIITMLLVYPMLVVAFFLLYIDIKKAKKLKV